MSSSKNCHLLIFVAFAFLLNFCHGGCYHYFDCLADSKDPTYLLSAKPACFVYPKTSGKTCVIPDKDQCPQDTLAAAQTICDKYPDSCLGVVSQGGKFEPKLATGSRIGPLPSSMELWVRCERDGMWQYTSRVVSGIKCTPELFKAGTCVAAQNMASESACKNACEQDKTLSQKKGMCNMYEYNKSTKACSHYRGSTLDNLAVTTEADPTKQMNILFGYKDCLQPKVKYSGKGTVLKTVTSIKIGSRTSPIPPKPTYDVNVAVADATLCSRACRMTTGCKYFNWDLNGSTYKCELLKDIRDVAASSTTTFGPLDTYCSTAMIGEKSCPYISVEISGTDNDKIIDEADVFSAQMQPSADFKKGNYELKNGKMWYLSGSGNALHFASNSWMISTPAGVYLSDVGSVSVGGDIFIDTRPTTKMSKRVVVHKCLLSQKGDVPTAPFASNDRIQWKDTNIGSQQEGNWLPGRVSKKNTDGTYVLLLDDGAEVTKAKETNIKGMSEADEARTKFQLEELVEGRRSDSGAWDQGQVKILQKNGLYTVVYDSDGFVDTYMTPARLRQFSIYKLKEQVEVIQYFWFPCTVNSINPDGSYLITFDDINRKQNKNFEDIRPKKVHYSPGTVVMSTFKSGAKVMAVIIASDPQQPPDQLNRYQVGVFSTPEDIKSAPTSCADSRKSLAWNTIKDWSNAPDGCHCLTNGQICFTTTEFLAPIQTTTQ